MIFVGWEFGLLMWLTHVVVIVTRLFWILLVKKGLSWDAWLISAPHVPHL